MDKVTVANFINLANNMVGSGLIPTGEQGNITNNKWIEHDGIKMIQADWARYLGMPVRNIVRDLKRKPFDVIYKERIAAKQNLNSLKQ